MSSLRVAVIGLAGSGKSTTAAFVEELAGELGLRHVRLKLAKPLYDLQAEVYRVAGVPIEAGAQDQVLMENLASALRRIHPESLVDDFLRRLHEIDADVVLNDDLRDAHVDAPALRRHGFRIVRVTADPAAREPRLAARGDISRSDGSTAELDLIEADARIDNSGDLTELRATARDLIRSWL